MEDCANLVRKFLVATQSEAAPSNGALGTERSCVLARSFALYTVITLAIIAPAQSFTPKYFPYNPYSQVLEVDLNGDGIPDFIAYTGSGSTELLSSGGGNFTTQNVSIPGGAYPIASGDFNKDGKADVIFFGFGNFDVGYGDGHGAFTSFQPITWTNSGSPNDVRAQIADFNSDGRPDLAMAF